MISLTLYTTAGCHLCDLADDILKTLVDHYSLTIIHTEIGDDDALVERYGVRIPVLKFPDDSELGWPFERQDIENKINHQQA